MYKRLTRIHCAHLPSQEGADRRTITFTALICALYLVLTITPQCGRVLSTTFFNFAPPVPLSCAYLCGAATCCRVDAEFRSGFARGPPATAQAPALIQDERRGWISITSLYSAGLLCLFGESPAFGLLLFSLQLLQRAARWRKFTMEKKRLDIFTRPRPSTDTIKQHLKT